MEKPLAYTSDQLAELLSVSRKTVFNNTEPRGTLKPTRIGTSVRFTAQEVDRWLSERSKSA